MKKVIHVRYWDEDFKGRIFNGITECCGEFVVKHVKGTDEHCPNCGEWLDWWAWEDEK